MEGLVLAGTSSGVGKTVATLSVLAGLQDEGVAVQPAKAGPDFVDPSHHEAVTGTPSRTLDLWLQGEDGLRRNYWRGAGEACVVEGVMGLYDGDASSTAAVAAALDLPVVLVVDAKAGMESVAATALGFRAYADRVEPDVEVAGVLAQRCHGGRHERGIRDALPDELAYLGRIPPTADLEIPDRHLGLEMGGEAALDEDALLTAAESVDLDGLRRVARSPPRPGAGAAGSEGDGPAATAAAGAGTDGPEADAPADRRSSAADAPRIAVARDDAFCFSYPATLERLRERAAVATFSPVAGDPVPEADGIYLPGGYPELHADRLAESPTLDALADRAADEVPIYGECGGMMALTESLTTSDGRTRSMAGVLPATVAMHDRYQALDHVALRAETDAPTADAGDRVRGHEFHYSSVDPAPDATFAFAVERGDGMVGPAEAPDPSADRPRDGLLAGNAVGTYCHCHPETGVFDAFLDRCRSR